MVLPERLGIFPAAVLVAALATMNFLVGLGQPPHPLWDETYYLTAAQRYEDGTAQFATHPPLGLMLIAAGDALLHPNRGTDTRAIGWDKQVQGERPPEHYSFAGVRLMSGVFAVIGAVVFFAVMLALTHSAFAALLLSNLYVFENAFHRNCACPRSNPRRSVRIEDFIVLGPTFGAAAQAFSPHRSKLIHPFLCAGADALEFAMKCASLNDVTSQQLDQYTMHLVA